MKIKLIQVQQLFRNILLSKFVLYNGISQMYNTPKEFSILYEHSFLLSAVYSVNIIFVTNFNCKLNTEFKTHIYAFKLIEKKL